MGDLCEGSRRLAEIRGRPCDASLRKNGKPRVRSAALILIAAIPMRVYARLISCAFIRDCCWLTPFPMSVKRCPESTMRTAFLSLFTFSTNDARRARPPSALCPQVGQGKRCPLTLPLWIIVKGVVSAVTPEAGDIEAKKRSAMVSSTHLHITLSDL